MKNWTRLLSLIGIIVLINLLSKQYFFRIDTTKDKQYTLSQATNNILKDLPEPVTVSAYFTKDLPQQYLKNYTDIKDLLVEYSVRSKGMVNYEFIDPADDPQIEQQALSNGISPLLINVREKDEVAQKKAWMGAIVSAGDKQDVLGYIPPGGALEYILTTSIKKTTSLEKPYLGVIQGYGCPNFQDLGLLMEALNIQYTPEPLNLASVENIDSKYKTVVLIRPIDTIPPSDLQKLTSFRGKSGNLCLAINAVEGDFQSVQGRELGTGVPEWLRTIGVQLNKNFVIDASSGSVTVQQRQGFFTINSQVEFPYFPLVKEFGDHPVTKGLEQVVFQFVSNMSFTGDSLSNFTPVVVTSTNSGIETPPVYFDIQKTWRASDFTQPPQIIAGIVEPSMNLGGVAVFGDGDFALGAQGRGQTPDNVSLLVNAIDYLSDDTGLIDLRTKGVATRPIKDLEDSEKSRIKWISFLLPIALVLGYAFFRFQKGRTIRLKRMAIQYV